MAQILELAVAMTEAVARFRESVRTFFYSVVLSGHPCPHCGDSLLMAREGEAVCTSCSRSLDPTVTFQRCSACGGQPGLRIRRYQCRRCGRDVPSRFLFDGLVFDAGYFRQKVAESRERRQELRERVRQMLAECRSGPVAVPAAELTSTPGLLEALNGLTQITEASDWHRPAESFSLSRYQAHIEAHFGGQPVSLLQIPPLGENARQDLIWRFIAILFLDHAGIVEIWQDGPDIMVIQREIDAEGQGVPGDPEESGGLEGSHGGTAAW